MARAKGTANTLLRIDTSDVEHLINGLKLVYGEKTFQQIMYRVMKRAGTRTRKLVKKEVTVDYQAPSGWVGSAIGDARIQTSASGAGCIIPVDGVRGKLGAQYKAQAQGANGNKITAAYQGRKGKRSRRSYKITAQIVKSGASEMPSSGERPHIKIMGRSGNTGGFYVVRRDLGTYIATSRKRTKHGVITYKAVKSIIVPAVGIGVPQMPMTRSADKIQQGVSQLLFDRIQHEHEVELRRYVAQHMG